MNNNNEWYENIVSLQHEEKIDTLASVIPNVLACIGLDKASVSPARSLEQIVQAMTDPRWTTRVAAARELGQHAEHAPLTPLLVALQDGHGSVRAAAVEAIGSFGARTPIEALVSALTDAEWEVREAAVFALSQQGERAPVSSLVPLLQDVDTTVRSTAVRSLGALGKHAPVQSIVDALQDNDWQVRESATTILRFSACYAPIIPLINTLHDESEQVRLAAIRTLTLIETSPCSSAVFAIFEQESTSVQPLALHGLRSCIALTLATLKEQGSIDPIMKAVRETKGPAHKAITYYLLARAINIINEQMPIEPLIPKPQDEPAFHTLFWQTLMRLTQTVLRARGQVEAIVAASKDQELAIRVDAEQAIIELVDLALSIRAERESTVHLTRVLQDTDHYASEMVMRDLIMFALKVLEERAPLSPVLAALKEPERRGRAAAVQTLVQRAQIAVAERRSPSEPFVFSCKRPSESSILKMQFGSSLLGQSTEEKIIFPWRDLWTNLLAKPLVPSALISHVDRSQYTYSANVN